MANVVVAVSRTGGASAVLVPNAVVTLEMAITGALYRPSSVSRILERSRRRPKRLKPAKLLRSA